MNSKFPVYYPDSLCDILLPIRTQCVMKRREKETLMAKFLKGDFFEFFLKLFFPF